MLNVIHVIMNKNIIQLIINTYTLGFMGWKTCHTQK